MSTTPPYPESSLTTPPAQHTAGNRPPAWTPAPPLHPHQQALPRTAPINSLAVASLVSSILGVVIFPLIGSIVGVILGHVSLDQIQRTDENGKGQALAGTILGYCGILLGVPAVISFFVLLPMIAASISARF